MADLYDQISYIPPTPDRIIAYHPPAIIGQHYAARASQQMKREEIDRMRRWIERMKENRQQVSTLA